MTGGRTLAAAALTALAFVAAALAPVWTYALSLALFGLSHVACELRYLDERFGGRIDGRAWRQLAALLLAIAALRAIALAGVGDATARMAIELLCGGALAVAVAPKLRRNGPLAAGLGLLALGLALTGASLAPAAALVAFAFVHNMTPLGLLAERLHGPARRRGLLLAAVGLVALPLLLVLGGRRAVADAFGAAIRVDGPLALGTLADALPAFVPGPWLDAPWARDLFTAAAFLQCMHYLVVIGWLPRLGAGDVAIAPKLRWPPPRAFARAVVAATLALTAAFALDFVGARAAYGVFASVHAWIEVPVLLLAVGGATTPRATTPLPEAA